MRYLFAGPLDEGEGQERAAVNVARFRDGRVAVDKRTVGTVKAPWWRESVPILLKEKTPAEIVADGVRAQLFRSGFIVTGPPARWNLETATLDRSWGRYVLGGVIEEMVLNGKNDPPFCDYEASVKLTFVLGDTQTGRTERFSLERESFFLWFTMTEDSLERQINSVVSQIIAEGLQGERILQVLRALSNKPRVP